MVRGVRPVDPVVHAVTGFEEVGHRLREREPTRYRRETQRVGSPLLVAAPRACDGVDVFWHGGPSPFPPRRVGGDGARRQVTPGSGRVPASGRPRPGCRDAGAVVPRSGSGGLGRPVCRLVRPRQPYVTQHLAQWLQATTG